MQKKTKRKSNMRRKKCCDRNKANLWQELVAHKALHTLGGGEHLFELTLSECLLAHGKCSDLGILIYGYCENLTINHCTVKQMFVKICVLKNYTSKSALLHWGGSKPKELITFLWVLHVWLSVLWYMNLYKQHLHSLASLEKALSNSASVFLFNVWW